MQADNLSTLDVKRFEKLFEEIKEENPKARMQTFLSSFRDKFKRKDCMFKNRCKK